MADPIPPRLLVIKARVPTGPKCEGCESYLDGDCFDNEILEYPDAGFRTPQCRARDAYQVVDPGSAAAELIEAAVKWEAANHAARKAVQEAPETAAACFEAERSAEFHLRGYARRVAEERKGR